MEFTIPRALAEEHEELHQALAEAIKLGGRTGEAAKRVADLLHPHFTKEEEYALPPLGLLRTLAEGRLTPEMRDAVTMTERLKSDLSTMLAEHATVVEALRDLATAAEAEHHPEVAEFAGRLRLHAEMEEQVLYPAAIVIGEYLKARRPKWRPGARA